MEAKDGRFGFDFAGTHTQSIPHELIEHSLGDRDAPVQFVEVAKGVHVSIAFDAETAHSIDQQRQGWQTILNNFAKYVQATL